MKYYYSQSNRVANLKVNNRKNDFVIWHIFSRPKRNDLLTHTSARVHVPMQNKERRNNTEITYIIIHYPFRAAALFRITTVLYILFFKSC